MFSKRDFSVWNFVHSFKVVLQITCKPDQYASDVSSVVANHLQSDFFIVDCVEESGEIREIYSTEIL